MQLRASLHIFRACIGNALPLTTTLWLAKTVDALTSTLLFA
jgi:hypothetical protein